MAVAATLGPSVITSGDRAMAEPGLSGGGGMEGHGGGASSPAGTTTKLLLLAEAFASVAVLER